MVLGNSFAHLQEGIKRYLIQKRIKMKQNFLSISILDEISDDVL